MYIQSCIWHLKRSEYEALNCTVWLCVAFDVLNVDVIKSCTDSVYVATLMYVHT